VQQKQQQQQQQQQQQLTDAPATDSESITLSDDSLNEFELKEEEYQSPYIIPALPRRLPASLRRPAEDDEDDNDDVILDSLTTTEKRPSTTASAGAAYPDSLNRPNSRGLFDSMASAEEEERPRRRLIQPYMDNSLSTGSFTSEQEEELEEENRGLVLQRHNNNINVKVEEQQSIGIHFPMYYISP